MIFLLHVTCQCFSRWRDELRLISPSVYNRKLWKCIHTFSGLRWQAWIISLFFSSFSVWQMLAATAYNYKHINIATRCNRGNHTGWILISRHIWNYWENIYAAFESPIVTYIYVLEGINKEGGWTNARSLDHQVRRWRIQSSYIDILNHFVYFIRDGTNLEAYT